MYAEAFVDHVAVSATHTAGARWMICGLCRTPDPIQHGGIALNIFARSFFGSAKGIQRGGVH